MTREEKLNKTYVVSMVWTKQDGIKMNIVNSVFITSDYKTEGEAFNEAYNRGQKGNPEHSLFLKQIVKI